MPSIRSFIKSRATKGNPSITLWVIVNYRGLWVTPITTISTSTRLALKSHTLYNTASTANLTFAPFSLSSTLFTKIRGIRSNLIHYLYSSPVKISGG